MSYQVLDSDVNSMYGWTLNTLAGRYENRPLISVADNVESSFPFGIIVKHDATDEMLDEMEQYCTDSVGLNTYIRHGKSFWFKQDINRNLFVLRWAK